MREQDRGTKTVRYFANRNDQLPRLLSRRFQLEQKTDPVLNMLEI